MSMNSDWLKHSSPPLPRHSYVPGTGESLTRSFFISCLLSQVPILPWRGRVFLILLLLLLHPSQPFSLKVFWHLVLSWNTKVPQTLSWFLVFIIFMSVCLSVIYIHIYIWQNNIYDRNIYIHYIYNIYVYIYTHIYICFLKSSFIERYNSHPIQFTHLKYTHILLF